ncbi:MULTISPECIES: hypothetical protein [Pseudomonadaceae]|jgi:hypothetical protein|uniref:Uncharacterized protein n=1 Tax=Ectopseudomonas toyotomiensis TaxID=554344 RepID=A0AA42IMI0_9GAMM|nr:MULTISPECIES: hypothetical protein [Pseudomonadaceae]RRU92649.1 hypothetical protein EGI97_16275 [Stutzerimonas xanthomarina]HCF6385912.1 hypothetical protein [Pseudomonas aeruginosa]MBA1261985.1 hypothetical protein [Stutzerimonas stutzeri]MBG0842256.1 hypothetical protein [Pseudomonas toyotomiensis]MDH0702020.1 hypothetical protein [Pseudomonas toyotomiensis]
MNTITKKPPIDSEILFALNKQAQQSRVELGSLLRAFGAPTTLAQAAAVAWKNELQIKEDPDSGSQLYYLPIQRAADFIDLILDQLDSDSRTEAVQFRDSCRAIEASASKISRLQQTKPHVYAAWLQWMDSDQAKQTVHKILSGQHQRTPATSSNHAALGGQ